MIPLFWFGLPVNIDSRFLMPAAAVAMVPLAFPFGSNRTWNACMHGLYLIGIVWILVGRYAQFPPLGVSLPGYMAGWLSLRGLLASDFLRLFGAFAVVAGLAYFFSRRSAHVAPAMTAVFCAGCVILTVGSRTWCGTLDPCTLLNISPTFIRPTMLDAWRWTNEHIDHATIAYTGNNVPYPLFCEQLTNHVYYVNIDRHASWGFHDYARAHSTPGATEPSDPLAHASGELVPLGPNARDAAPRPRYERRDGYREAWVENLRSLGIDRLFVSALSAYEIDFVWHNDRGFPIEDEWAKADPQTFRLVFENLQVRIYRLAQP